MIKQLFRFLHPKFQNLFLEYNVDLKPRYGHGNAVHPHLLTIIESNRDTYKDLLKFSLKYKTFIWQIEETQDETNPSNPVWDNQFLPGLDIIGIYTILSKFNPKKYIEIGSGTSTKVAFKAKQEQHLDTQIISIDPMPRTEIDDLADIIIREPFENTNYNVLESLNENDILFIDNSHRILPNSDSTVFYLEILPRLKKGVIVQIHDVYLPSDYPQFMCDRFYSEQYGLAMYLLANPKKYVPILPNYFISEDAELASIIAPMWNHHKLKNVEKHGGSFWLKINE